MFFKDFPGRWGKVNRIDLSAPSSPSSTAPSIINNVHDAPTATDSTNSLRNRLRNLFRDKNETDKSHKLLGEWRATSIAGNDISASCLYTAGICAQKGN